MAEMKNGETGGGSSSVLSPIRSMQPLEPATTQNPVTPTPTSVITTTTSGLTWPPPLVNACQPISTTMAPIFGGHPFFQTQNAMPAYFTYSTTTPQSQPFTNTTQTMATLPLTQTYPTPLIHPTPYVNQWTPPFHHPTPSYHGQPYAFTYMPLNDQTYAQPPQTGHRRVTSPFAKELLDYEIPNTSKLPTLRTYDGTTDPDSHIDTYEWHMTSLKLDERFWCTYFPTTLDGNAGTWFKTLTPGSIHSFEQLKQQFLTNFMQLRRYRGNNHAIIGCKQREGESVKEYFKIFTKATLDVPGQDEGLVRGAFTWGLLPGALSKKFLGRPPQNRHELKERVERFLRQEDGTAEKQAYLRATTESRQKYGGRPTFFPLTQNNYRPTNRQLRPPRRHHPFHRGEGNDQRPDVYVVTDKARARPGKEKVRHCEYHNSRTHDTDECNMLKREIENRQLKGNLTDIARDLRAKREERNPPREVGMALLASKRDRETS